MSAANQDGPRSRTIGDVVPAEDRLPWEKRPDESVKAFHAFAVARDLGPTRSLAKAAQVLIEEGTRKGTIAGVRADLGEWSVKYDWQARFEAFELWRDRREREASEDEVDRMRRRHAQTGALINGLVLERVVGREPGVLPNGKTVEGISRLNPAELDAGDVARLAQVAVQIERLSVGLPMDLTQSLNTLTRQEGEKIVSGIVELALNRLPVEQHEAFIRDVQLFGESFRRK